MEHDAPHSFEIYSSVLAIVTFEVTTAFSRELHSLLYQCLGDLAISEQTASSHKASSDALKIQVKLHTELLMKNSPKMLLGDSGRQSSRWAYYRDPRVEVHDLR